MRRTTAASLDPQDERPLPAEIVFLAVVLCLALFFTLAGIPGKPLPEAGEGSEALRQGWAEQAPTASELHGR